MIRAGAIVGAVVVAVAGAVAVAGRDGGDDGNESARMVLTRRGSTVVERDPAQALAPQAEPVSYRIDYRVRYRSGASNIERVAVKRPFESRTETYIGRPPRGRPDQLRESRFGAVASQSRDDDPSVLAAAPGVPEGDIRPRTAIEAAVEAKLLERRERRRVAGHECDVYRGGGPVTSGPLEPATKRNHTDVCIDARGLAMEIWEVVDGLALIQRVATTVQTDVGDIELSLPDKPSTPSDGAGSVGPVAPGSAPEGPAFAVDVPPSGGFAMQGRYAVVVSQAALADPTRQGEAIAGLADVWVRGPDFVAVEQGGRLDQSDAFVYREGSPRVDVPNLGKQGELLHGLTGSEIRVVLDGGRFVRAYGTVPMADLIPIVSGLRAVQGTGLQSL